MRFVRDFFEIFGDLEMLEAVFGGEYLTVSANGRRKRTPPTGGPLSVNQAEGVFGEVRKRF